MVAGAEEQMTNGILNPFQRDHLNDGRDDGCQTLQGKQKKHQNVKRHQNISLGPFIPDSAGQAKFLGGGGGGGGIKPRTWESVRIELSMGLGVKFFAISET
jgi:hypothetical protein